MAELTVNAIPPSGIDPSANLIAADAAGDTVKKASGLIFVVDNADAGARTVTVAAPVANAVCGGYGQVPVEDIVISIPAGESRHFSIPSGYAVDGEFAITYDAVTATTVGVFVASPNA